MSNALFPEPATKKIVGVTVMFSRDACTANFTPQTSSQKTLEQRVKSILLTLAIARDRQKNISLNEAREYARAVHTFEECCACIELYPIK